MFARSFRSRARNSTIKCHVRSAAGTSTESEGVNINKYKSQRSVISTDKRDLTAAEVNALMVKAGKGVCSQPPYPSEVRISLRKVPSN